MIYPDTFWYICCGCYVDNSRPGSTIADIDLQFGNESSIEEEQNATSAFSEYIIMNGGYLGNYTVVEILSADSGMRCKLTRI